MHFYKYVGTFFVNPGTTKFAAECSIWHEAYTAYGQEVANHTWLHEGGSTEPEAQQAVDQAGEYIKENIYNSIFLYGETFLCKTYKMSLILINNFFIN